MIEKIAFLLIFLFQVVYAIHPGDFCLNNTCSNTLVPFEYTDSNTNTLTCKCYCPPRLIWDSSTFNCTRPIKQEHKCPWNRCLKIHIMNQNQCENIAELLKGDLTSKMTPFPSDNNMFNLQNVQGIEVMWEKTLIHHDPSMMEPLKNADIYTWNEYRHDPKSKINNAIDKMLQTDSKFGRYLLQVKALDESNNEQTCTGEIVIEDGVKPTIDESCDLHEGFYTSSNIQKIQQKVQFIVETTHPKDDTCGSLNNGVGRIHIQSALTNEHESAVHAEKIMDGFHHFNTCTGFTEEEALYMQYHMHENQETTGFTTLRKCCKLDYQMEASYADLTCDPHSVLPWSKNRVSYEQFEMPDVCIFRSCMNFRMQDLLTTSIIKTLDTSVIENEFDPNNVYPDDFHFSIPCNQVHNGSEYIGICFVEQDLHNMLKVEIDWIHPESRHLNKYCNEGVFCYADTRYRIISGYEPTQVLKPWTPFRSPSNFQIFDEEHVVIEVQIWSKGGLLNSKQFDVFVHPHKEFDPCPSISEAFKPISPMLSNGVYCNYPDASFGIMELNWKSGYGQPHTNKKIPLHAMSCQIEYDMKGPFQVIHDENYLTQEHHVEYYGISLTKNSMDVLNIQCKLKYTSGKFSTCSFNRHFRDCDIPTINDLKSCSVNTCSRPEQKYLHQLCSGTEVRLENNHTKVDKIATDQPCCDTCGPSECQAVLDPITNPFQLKKCTREQYTIPAPTMNPIPFFPTTMSPFNMSNVTMSPSNMPNMTMPPFVMPPFNMSNVTMSPSNMPNMTMAPSPIP